MTAMKIVAVNGSCVVIETAPGWLVYNTEKKTRTEVDRREQPQYLAALVSKWGYYRVRKPIPVESLDAIDPKRVAEEIESPDWYS